MNTTKILKEIDKLHAELFNKLSAEDYKKVNALIDLEVEIEKYCNE